MSRPASAIDQVDLRDYRLADLRRQFAPGAGPLLDEHLRDIAYGRPGANESQIVAAAAAGAHKFISRLPRGYHRPSALGVCDMVLEVKDGRLVSPTSQEGAMR